MVFDGVVVVGIVDVLAPVETTAIVVLDAGLAVIILEDVVVIVVVVVVFQLLGIQQMLDHHHTFYCPCWVWYLLMLPYS